MAERHWYIKNCDLFEQLEPAHFSALERDSRLRKFAKGSPVYLPADASDSVFLLAEGRIKLISITPDGKQAILAFIEPGELFGEMALFGAAGREEYAEAMAASVVVMLPTESLDRVMQDSPSAALRVTKLVGLRRQRVERRLRSLLFRSNRDRLVHFLLELCETYGKPTADGLHLAIPLSHQDIANVIGTTRETVTHLLGELQLNGVLKVGRQKLVVRDTTKLAAEVEDGGRARQPDRHNVPEKPARSPLARPT